MSKLLYGYDLTPFTRSYLDTIEKSTYDEQQKNALEKIKNIQESIILTTIMPILVEKIRNAYFQNISELRFEFIRFTCEDINIYPYEEFLNYYSKCKEYYTFNNIKLRENDMSKIVYLLEKKYPDFLFKRTLRRDPAIYILNVSIMNLSQE